MKEFWKSVKIWQSYCQTFGGFLFWNTVYILIRPVCPFVNGSLNSICLVQNLLKCDALLSRKSLKIVGDLLKIWSTFWFLAGCEWLSKIEVRKSWRHRRQSSSSLTRFRQLDCIVTPECLREMVPLQRSCGRWYSSSLRSLANCFGDDVEAGRLYSFDRQVDRETDPRGTTELKPGIALSLSSASLAMWTNEEWASKPIIHFHCIGINSSVSLFTVMLCRNSAVYDCSDADVDTRM